MPWDSVDRWRDEDGPSERDVELLLDDLDRRRLDQRWTEVTVAHLEDLNRASAERVQLRRRLAAAEVECRRLRDELRAAM